MVRMRCGAHAVRAFRGAGWWLLMEVSALPLKKTHIQLLLRSGFRTVVDLRSMHDLIAAWDQLVTSHLRAFALRLETERPRIRPLDLTR